MLTKVAAIINEKTIFPPSFHPILLFIYQPTAKHNTERTNHTAKLLSPKLKSLVFIKFDANIIAPRKRGKI
jgi:hypothetical protein